MTDLPENFWESRFQERRTPWERGELNPAFLSWRAAGALAPCRILVPGAGRSPKPAVLMDAGFGHPSARRRLPLAATRVDPVVRVLRENGIEVTAVHNHMLDDQPRLFSMHFWANDDASKLVKGLRAALEKVNLVRS